MLPLQVKLTKVMEKLTGTTLSELESPVQHYELEKFKRLGFKEPLAAMRCALLERSFVNKLCRPKISPTEYTEIIKEMNSNIKEKEESPEPSPKEEAPS